jgi:hypothetical protein
VEIIFPQKNLIYLNKSLPPQTQSSQPLRSHGGRQFRVVLLNHGRAIAHLPRSVENLSV